MGRGDFGQRRKGLTSYLLKLSILEQRPLLVSAINHIPSFEHHPAQKGGHTRYGMFPFNFNTTGSREVF